MQFDKNQTEFPSPLHEAIWDCGIHILPLEMALPREVADDLQPSLAESCRQLHAFMLLLLSDMYENTAFYLPICDNRRLGIQYRFFRPLIDYALLGETEYNRYKPKNGYGTQDEKGVTYQDRLKMMERAGLRVAYKGDSVVLTNALFPEMFPAMRAMAQAIAARKEKVSGDNCFMNCDFRVLCPSYKYDKIENALVFLSDEQRQVALALMEIAKKPGMTRSVPNGICGAHSILYKHKKREIMVINCMGNRVWLRFRIWYDRENPAPLEAFFRSLEEDSPALKRYFARTIKRCRSCKGETSGRCAAAVDFCGSTIKLCEPWWGAMLWEKGVSMEELPLIEKIFDRILLYI